jgi:transglutaminase-like putative cysteine protease
LPRVEKLQVAFAGDDWERARAVYIWVTEHIAYDTAAYFSGRYGALDAESVFRSGSSVCSGYSKGAGYRPGQSFRSTNHAWNAIYIDGGRHLFDSTLLQYRVE